MSEKKKVAVYYRTTSNKSQMMNEEEQKKLIKESRFFSSDAMQDYCDNCGEQERKDAQFERMISDIKANKIEAVTLLEREESSEQEMEWLKSIMAEAKIPLYVCKNNEVKKVDIL